MVYISKVCGIWILDEDSRTILVQRTYIKSVKDDQFLKTFFSTIFSFSRVGLETGSTDAILLDDRKIVYETAENIVFIAVVRTDFEDFNAKRILSHLRAPSSY